MEYSEPPPEETRLTPQAITEQSRSQPRISWTDGEGNHTAVIDGKMVVGSAPASNIVVHHPTVSRIHAELEARQDGVWVRDLGSRNGTFVDSLQVTGARVPDKGTMRLGSAELHVDYNPTQRRSIEIWPHAGFGASRSHGCTSAHHWRDRHRQRARRACDPRCLAARIEAIRGR
jgi:pSer/pThr/pTyr-binding forkhead associated (FHA) protein